MKQFITIIAVLFTTFTWMSCEKVDTDPDALDYYKNKNIVLTISSENFDAGDNLHVKISAIHVGDSWIPNPKIMINGTAVEGEYAVLTSEMLADGPITITSTDKAWQYVAEYTLSSNATPYGLLWSSTFDDVAQDPIYIEVNSSISKTGIIEIKEYK